MMFSGEEMQPEADFDHLYQQEHRQRKLLRAALWAIEPLESRLLLSTGGGFSGAGITGQYFNNTTLTGSPSFTRTDDRVDFNFGSNVAPGGSNSPGFNAIGTTNWSARWTGQIVPKYSETYTFTITSAAGVRLYIELPGASAYTTIINDWTSHAVTVDSATYALSKGQTYNIKLEYYQSTGAAEIKLHWSSPSTPDEPIEAATPVGLNIDAGYAGDAAFANLVNGGSRNVWYAAGNMNQTVATDTNFWPQADSEIFLDEGDIALNSGGTYLIQFQGTAQINQSGVSGSFYIGSQDYYGSIPAGTGYSNATGLTTATLVVNPGNYNGFTLEFTNTSREDNTAAPQHDGITSLYVMQPTALAGSTDYQPGTLFTNAALSMVSQYDTIRDMGLTDTNGSLVSNWSDRTVPADEIWNGWSITPDSGVTAGVNTTAGTGIPWEVCVALANQTGKDLYINVPSNASLDYINKLAELIAFGSDGVNPYTSPQTNPVWAPLNPNLKVYIEFSNEIWNYAFTQSGTGGNGWIDQLSQRAVYDYLTNNQNDSLYPGGGANGYNDGAIVAPQYINSSNKAAFLATYNGTNASWPGYGSPQYFSNASSVTGASIYQGWVALRLEQIASAFKTDFNETGVYSDSNLSRVRPVFEWQYGGSWSGELGEMQAMFGSQHPVGYYLYGGGGGWYSDNVAGGFSDTSFANDNFAAPSASGYQQSPSGSSWTFSGAAGIAANGSSLGNPTAPTAGPPDNPNGSTQTAYMQPGASISQLVNFSGGWADITLLAAQSQASNYYPSYYGTTISVDGNPIAEGEGAILYSGNSTADTWTWARTAAFNVSAGYHTVTFTNNWPTSGATVFLDDVAIQTVNGLFNETATNGAPNITSTIKSDVALCLQYGLNDVGYEGGYDFNQNLDGGDANGYNELGSRGYSNSTPNVGMEANLDPRTVPLAEATLNQFYTAGGSLPIVFESSGNINSWAVAAPTYFDFNTPKQQAVAAVEQVLPPAANYGITVPNTLLPVNKSQDSNDTNGSLQTNGWISWDIIVPVTGTYQFTATTNSGGNYSFSIDGTNVFASGTTGGTINPTLSLTPGFYSFEVQATSGSFTVSQVVVSEPGAPAAPTITSSSFSGGTAIVSWTTVAGASGYLVAYGNAAGQYSTFTDAGNTTTANITGLNPASVYHVAIYAYNSAQQRSLPSADVRLAPRSTDPSQFVDFENLSVSDNTTIPLTEPVTYGNFLFTSFGNSGGAGLVAHDSGDTYYGFPTKALFTSYWGTSDRITRSDSHSFDLYSLDLETYQAGSAVITGYDASGGTLTQIVNFLYPANYAISHQVLDWTDLVKVEITWWDNLNGVSNARDGAIDNVVFNDLSPTITSASANPSAVTGTSTALSVVATDNNGESNLLYTWTATTLPTGVATPIFSDNNTNSAKNITAYFSSAGNYVFTVKVTDGSNLVATQTVPVTVTQTAGGITVFPASPTVADGSTQAVTAVVGDQFGAAMGSQPAFTWTIASGLGAVSSSGLFTAPGAGSGWTYVTATGGGYSQTGAVCYTTTPAPNYYSGFSGNKVGLSGNTTLTSGHLRLTSGQYQAGAAWYGTKLADSSFVTDFEFQTSYLGQSSVGGNGLTFTIQNQSATAVGSNQSGLGYQGITSSVALKFDLAPWDSSWSTSVGQGDEELDSVGVFTNGAAPTTPATDLSSTRIQLRDGDLFRAHVTYDGMNLAVTLVDMTDVHHYSVTESYAVNIPAIVGATTAWFGFTAGSTQVVASSYQDILWWTYGQPQASISPIGNSTSSAPASITANFTRPVLGFNLSDLSLVRDGQTIALGATQLISTANGGITYQLSNLAPAATQLGQYTLTATASGLTDAGGNLPLGSLSAIWVLNTLIGTATNNSITIAGGSGSTATITANGAAAYTVNLLNLSQIIVNGAIGTDTLTLDYTNGSPLPSGGLTYNGGSGGSDSLIVTGSANADTASIGGSQLIFDGSVISMSNVQTVTLNTAAGNDALTQTSQPAPANVTFNSGTGTDQLTVNSGSYSFTADPNPLSANLLVTAIGVSSSILFNPQASNQIHLGGLTLSGGATAAVVSLGNLRTQANHRTLIVGSAGATSGPVFNIDSSSTLNLADNDLIIHAGNPTNVNTLLTWGINTSAGGYWNGKGIASSNAAAGRLTALGLGQPVVNGTFDSEPVSTADVLVKYTFYGDANLDGKIDGTDYSRIDYGYLNHLTGWANGDFNYDGVVDGSDYTLIDNAFNTQPAQPLSQIVSPSAAIQSIIAPVTAARITSVPTANAPARSAGTISESKKSAARHDDLQIITHAIATPHSSAKTGLIKITNEQHLRALGKVAGKSRPLFAGNPIWSEKNILENPNA